VIIIPVAGHFVATRYFNTRSRYCQRRHVTYRAAANEQFSTRVLVDTGSSLIQAANDKEGVVGQLVPGARMVRALNSTPPSTCIFSDLFPGWPVAMKSRSPEFFYINSDNSSTNCKKTATGNTK